MVYPALLPLMRTPRLPVVDWTDAPADLNGLVRFAERRNLFSERVPSRFKHSLIHWKKKAECCSAGQEILLVGGTRSFTANLIQSRNISFGIAVRPLHVSPWRQPTAYVLIMRSVYSVYQQHSELSGSDTLRETHADRLNWADSLYVRHVHICCLFFARGVELCWLVSHTVTDWYPFPETVRASEDRNAFFWLETVGKSRNSL